MTVTPKSIGPWLFACVVVIAIAALVMTGHEVFVVHAICVGASAALLSYMISKI